MVFKIASCIEVPNIFVEMFYTSFYQNVSVRVAASFCWWCYIFVFLLTFFSTFCLTPSSLLIQIKSVKTFQRKKAKYLLILFHLGCLKQNYIVDVAYLKDK